MILPEPWGTALDRNVRSKDWTDRQNDLANKQRDQQKKDTFLKILPPFP
jgi:hypothetical protein